MMKRMITLGLAIGLVLAAHQAPAASTALSVQKIIRAGVIPTPQTLITATASYSVTLTAGELIRVSNMDAATTVTLTFTDQRTNKEGYTTNSTLVLGPSAIGYVGPFMKNRWGNASGLLIFSMTGTTQSAKAEVVRLPFGEPEAQTK